MNSAILTPKYNEIPHELSNKLIDKYIPNPLHIVNFFVFVMAQIYPYFPYGCGIVLIHRESIVKLKQDPEHLEVLM